MANRVTIYVQGYGDPERTLIDPQERPVAEIENIIHRIRVGDTTPEWERVQIIANELVNRYGFINPTSTNHIQIDITRR